MQSLPRRRPSGCPCWNNDGKPGLSTGLRNIRKKKFRKIRTKYRSHNLERRRFPCPPPFFQREKNEGTKDLNSENTNFGIQKRRIAVIEIKTKTFWWLKMERSVKGESFWKSYLWEAQNINLKVFRPGINSWNVQTPRGTDRACP